MDREILFKGKHIHALPGNEHLDDRWIEGYLADKNHINSPELEGEFLVDPETVCQYTGLNDSTKWEQLSESEKNKFLSEWNYKKERKNVKEDWIGRKIFEGDILLYIDRECPDDILRELVAWNGFSWVTRRGKRDIVMSKWECEHMEVIGNIFDDFWEQMEKDGI